MPEDQITTEEPVVDVGEPAEQQAEPTSEDRLATLERELAEEREARKRVEAQSAEIQRAAEFYRGLAYQQNPGQPQGPTISPDDVPDVRTVEQIVQQRTMSLEQQVAQERMARMEAAARSKFSDWDAVMARTVEMAQERPGLAAAILNSADPAETAYYIGRTHPSFSRNGNGQAVVDRIAKNAAATKTLSSATGQQAPVRKNWREASDEEILARAARIVSGGGA